MYQNIICAVDLSEISNRVIEAAKSLTTNEKIILIHCCEHPVTGYGEKTGKNHMTTEMQIKQSLHPQLEELCQRHEIPSNQALILFGDTTEQIGSQLEKRAADLIVVGHQHHSFLKRVFGSTPNELINRAPCSVLIVK